MVRYFSNMMMRFRLNCEPQKAGGLINSEYASGSFFGKSAWLVAIGLLVMVSMAQGQQAGSISGKEVIGNNKVLTLPEAINVALANNSEVKRSLLSLKSADQQVRLAWSEVMPDISASAGYTRNLEIPVNFVPAKFFDPDAPEDKLTPLQFGTDNNWQGGISVSQTIFRGEAIVGIGSSKVYKAVQSESLRATAQQIVTQTRTSYYNVLATEEQLRLQQAAVERLKKNLDENKTRQKAGLIDDYAVLQVQVELSNEQPKLTQARYAVQQAYRNLSVVLGIPLKLEFSVLGDLNSFNITSRQVADQENQSIKKVDTMTPYQYRKAPRMIEGIAENRGDLRVLDKQNALKEREIKALKSRFLPTLTADYNLNWTASQPGSPVFFGHEDTRARSQTIGLTLRLPIFQGFQRSANLSIAQIEKKDLEVQERATLRAAKNDIQSARESLNQAIETAPARKKALKLAREGYERARSRFENGLGSQLDVTNAELQLRRAEANYAQMVANYLSAKAQYDLAIGSVPFVDSERSTLND